MIELLGKLPIRLFISVIAVLTIGACSTSPVRTSMPNNSTYYPNFSNVSRDVPKAQAAVPESGWTVRVITEEDLDALSDRNPDLTPSICRGILARINVESRCNIADDLKVGKPLKVPNDFTFYKDWTPVPKYLPQFKGIPKCILVDKSHPFLGWYEKGVLVGDTQACIGKSGEETNAGLYRVQEKVEDHHSRSYKNDFGQPAWMPYAMRLYEQVWIHAGDVTGPNCSHGCVTLPMFTAEALFLWAEPGTPVLIVESIEDMASFQKKTESNPSLLPESQIR